LPKLARSRTGDVTELEVATHFLKQGYEVFRNMGSTGLIDLVVVCPKTKEVLLYDVKTTTEYKDKDGVTTVYANTSTDEQRKLGVEIVALHKGKIYTDPIRIKERFEDESKTVN
jgi:Holliday junction resolvase-like predicted endonuclease